MPGGKRTLTGRVVSNKMEKTVIVEVETSKRHPLYRRTIRIRKRYKAHDEDSVCSEGDVVSIIEHRPISKDKRWLVRDVIGHLEAPNAEENEIDIGASIETETALAVEEQEDIKAEAGEDEDEDEEEADEDEDEEDEDEHDEDEDKEDEDADEDEAKPR